MCKPAPWFSEVVAPVPENFSLQFDGRVTWLTPTVLVAGSPRRVVRLSREGAAVVRLLEQGSSVRAAVGAHGPIARDIARRLLDGDMAIPDPGSVVADLADVTVVIPARNADAVLPRLLASLPPGLAEVIVVDDGSSDATARVASQRGARVLRRGSNHGPSAARNAGLAEVQAPLVFFVDADAVVCPSAIERLAVHLDDPAVVMVGPRIQGLNSGNDATGLPGLIQRYEACRSPLDLGPRAGRVRRGASIPFVPSAALLARRSVLAGIGGFDESLDFNEDGDLVWRLDEAGYAVRYEPAAIVRHDHRTQPRAALRRRSAYASSAVLIERRHAGALAALTAPPGTLAAAAACATVGPAACAAITTGSIVAESLPLIASGVPPAAAVRLTATEHVTTARATLFAITRPWLPAAIAAGVLNRRARRVVVGALLTRHLLEWRRVRPPIGPAAWVSLRTVDDFAYATGLWHAAIADRSFAPLAIRLRRRGRLDASNPDWVELNPRPTGARY